MAITTIQDLKVNNEYYLYIGKDLKGNHLKPRKVRLLGIIQEFKNTELYVENLKPAGKKINWSTNIWCIDETGIGTTEQEAIQNFCKLDNCKVPMAYGSPEEVDVDLIKNNSDSDRYTYLNRRTQTTLSA
jgi:hypothetical protein